MLFGRRHPESFLARLRIALWPRHSWRRSVRYLMLRLERLDATPHAIGLGLAVGVFTSFQPILGFQMLFAGAVAWLLRASVGAALIGTFAGGPVTWPIMWLASYQLGAALLGDRRGVGADELWRALSGVAAAALEVGEGAGAEAGAVAWQVLVPLAVGAVPLGLVAGAGFYVMIQRAAALRAR